VKLTLSDSELAELRAAAMRRGVTLSRLAAEAALAAARGQAVPVGQPFQAALQELIETQKQARRIGVNLNQGVRALNTTGVAPDALARWAEEATRILRRLDVAAERLARKIP
jgi:hypothetical protein